MGYPENFKVSIRKIGKNVVTVSCPFSILGRFDLGNRMSLINCNGEVIVYSTIKYGDYFEEALRVLGASKVAYIVVVNFQHNMAVGDYVSRYPDAKVIAGGGLEPHNSWTPDVVFPDSLGNKPLTAKELKSELALDWPEGVQVVYLLHHKNKEVILYEEESKTLFEGDVLVNIGAFGEDGVEQYSPATGYPEKHNPLTGWSYPFRGLHARGWLGQYINQLLCRVHTEGGREGIKVITESWPVEQIVPCHGNVLKENALEEFKLSFPKIFSK